MRTIRAVIAGLLAFALAPCAGAGAVPAPSATPPGSLRVRFNRQQIARTLEQFPTVREVRFAVAGPPMAPHPPFTSGHPLVDPRRLRSASHGRDLTRRARFGRRPPG